MFKTRLLSGMVLVALALVLVYLGGDVLLASLLVLSLLGLFELYRVFGIEKSMIGMAGYAACILFYAGFRISFLPDSMAFSVGALTFFLLLYVLTYPKFKTEQILAAFFGIFYVPVLLSYIYQIRMLTYGIFLVWLVFLCSWGCDTCAYCVGVLFGRHKMTPELSPKKSIEGAAGGMAGSMLLTFLYVWILRGQMHLGIWEMLLLSAIGGLGGLISMGGDLAASAIKRRYGIKDFGDLIPGHGGILDRFDSVLFTAPILYYLAKWAISL